jgi:hypothetical protein
MRALSISIRSGPAVLALLAGISAHAEQAQRFTLTGTASLSRDQPALSDGKLVLRGYLQSRDAPSTAAIVQDGGRFTIMAKAVAVAQVCYNDTIFRDDFDGDGG